MCEAACVAAHAAAILGGLLTYSFALSRAADEPGCLIMKKVEMFFPVFLT